MIFHYAQNSAMQRTTGFLFFPLFVEQEIQEETGQSRTREGNRGREIGRKLPWQSRFEIPDRRWSAGRGQLTISGPPRVGGPPIALS